MKILYVLPELQAYHIDTILEEKSQIAGSFQAGLERQI